jgi:DNA helicase-2/ATP-dependent DNA helicase PcrA
MTTKNFTDGLNPAQKQAVESLHGPLLILAGAGSGKTRVLTHRVAQLVALGEAAPSQILAVTFTNKAAREMEERIVRLLHEIEIPVYDRLWISTFHSICARILRADIHLLEYQPFFGIYDDSEQLTMIKKCMSALNLNEKMFPPKSFQSQINHAKRLALAPEDVAKGSWTLMNDKALDVYKMYEDEMKKANSLDFGDLLMKTYELFRTYPAILEKYQNQFQFVMVDEYQDTNHIQYLLVKMLSDTHRNLCVVGDEDQSIYSWRGADIANILDFEKDFPEAQTVKLEENYRSTQTIVTAASHVIKNNSQRKDKTLFTRNESGEKIVVRGENTEYDEARFVANRIDVLLSSGEWGRKEIAIFYRTNAQSRVLEEQLRSRSIPYKIVGGMKFYDRLEIKDILGYMKALINPNDEIALRRIINSPTRGIGKTTIDTIEQYGIEHRISFYEAILKVAEQRLVHSGASKKLVGFRNLLDLMRTEMTDKKPSEVYHLILDRTEYAIRLKEENTPESLARIDNLEEFDNALKQFEQERGDEATLTAFLEEIALVNDIDEMEDSDDFITMMTLHISKGLEFPVVFMVGMEEGLFPSVRDAEDEGDQLEEERRLAYVGMTRARRLLYMTHARIRRVWGQEQSNPPSRFLDEIPKELISEEGGIRRPAFLNHFIEKFGSGKKVSEEDFSQPPAYEDFPQNESGSFSKGQRVRHPTFGVGSIYQIEGAGENQKVSVVFSDNTSKKFIVKYARLEPV